MTALETAKALVARGAWREALTRLRALSDASPTDDVRVLTARVLRQLNRPREAATLLAEVLSGQPENSVVAHNLAAALGDAGDFQGAIAGANHALGLKPRAETWLVLGRGLIAQGDLSQAKRALMSAAGLQPGNRDVLRELSQLIWMQTRDPAAALAPLHAALKQSSSCELAAMTGGIIRELGTPREAYDFLKLWADKNSAVVHLAAASAAATFDTHLQLQHAEAAMALAPTAREARNGWAAALLCAGRPAEALVALNAWLMGAPDDQHALALRLTALRMLALPGQLEAEDYQRLVGVFDLPAPSPWQDHSAWLSELSEALHRLHAFAAEPFGQSVRHGAQSRMDPRFAGEPAVDAAFAAFASALAQYRKDTAGYLHSRTDPDLVISGAWSVRLASGGHHNDHIHPAGRVSSAFYVEVPEGAAGQREGWLRFGGVELGGHANLSPEFWVEPRPGRLVLFPSYVWHGTEPFSGSGYRLSIAFDARAQS